MKKLLWVFALALSLQAARNLFAEASQIITYQGRLKENNQPVTGNRSIEILLCNALTGGVCNTSGVQDVYVSTGLFKSTFTAPGAADVSAGAWYLELKVGGQALSPREALSSVPYALYSTSAAYAGSLAVSAGAGVIASTHVYLVNGSSLTVAGDVMAHTFYGSGAGLTGITGASGTDSTKVLKTGDTMTGQLTLGNNSSMTVTGNAFSVGGSTLVVANGNVGIGTAAPGSKLDILDGSVTVRGVNAGLILETVSRSLIPETDITLGAGIRVSTNIYIVGFSSAAKYYGDGSSLTGVTADNAATVNNGVFTTGSYYDPAWITGLSVSKINLSTVTAALAGKLSSTDIVPPALINLSTVAAEFALRVPYSGAAGPVYLGAYGITASSFTAAGAGLSAARLLLADNVAVSSETDASLGGGARVSTNVYIVGFSSAARYYGDGSGLVGLNASMLTGNIPAGSLGNAVLKTGDTMTGTLTIAGSTLTVTGSAFSVGGSTFVVADGKIGIGTATPTGQLTIAAGVENEIELYSTGSNVQILATGSPGQFLIGNGSDFEIRVNGLERMRINDSGYVGIGTAYPGSRFDVLDGSITVRGENAAVVLADSSRVISPETAAGFGAGIRVSTNVYIVGFSSATRYYGDGSNLTGLTAVSAGVASNAANLSGGNVGQLPYQSAADTTMMLSAGTAGQVLQSNGNAAPSWTTDISGNAATVTNGVYTSGSYADPGWITSIAGSKITGDVGGAAVNNVLKAGDTMTGQLTLGNNSTMTVTGNAFSVGGSTLVVANGNLGLGTTNPQGRLDVSGASRLNFAASPGSYGAEIGGGAMFTQFSGVDNNVKLTANTSGTGFKFLTDNGAAELLKITGTGNVGIGTTNPTAKLEVLGIVNVSSMVISGLDGGIALLPYVDAAQNYAYFHGIAIGSNTYGNYNYGVGLGDSAYNNRLYGVGIGYSAHDNYNGVGVGNGAYGNHSAGVGVGIGANNNSNYAVGVGAFSEDNKPYGSALGAYSYASSSSVALGSYAKANAERSIAIGAETINNSTGTASFGAYAIVTSSNITANKYYGDASALTGVPGDGLGNHIATTTLNMFGNGIVNASSIAANYFTAYSTMTVAGNAFSVGGSTLVVSEGMLSLGAPTSSVGNPWVGGMLLELSGQSMQKGWRTSMLVIDGTMTAKGGEAYLTGLMVKPYYNFQDYANWAEGIHIGSMSPTGSSYALNVAGLTIEQPTFGRTCSAAIGIGQVMSGYCTGDVYRKYGILQGDPAAQYNFFVSSTGFGVGLPTQQVDVAGNVNASGAYYLSGNKMLAILPGTGSLGVGVGAGGVVAGGTVRNSFLGYNTGSSNTTGLNNSFVGSWAGNKNISGNANSFMGAQAGEKNTIGKNNTFMGYGAGWTNATGNDNTIVGYSAGYNTITGSANAIFGSASGGTWMSGYSFSSSTLMGYMAGYKLKTGSDNILIGFQAGYAIENGTGNIVIGYNKDTSATGANNELNIGGVIYGDLSAKTIGISTRVPQAALDIVSTGTASSVYAQIWRSSDGTVVASMTATGTLYTAVPPLGDNLGNHIATTTLNMSDFGLVNVSSIIANGYMTMSSATITQNAGIGGTLGVTGDVNLAGKLNVDGTSTFVSSVTAKGNIQLGDAYNDIHGVNMVPAADTALSIAGQSVSGDYAVKFYSGATLIGGMRKK